MLLFLILWVVNWTNWWHGKTTFAGYLSEERRSLPLCSVQPLRTSSTIKAWFLCSALYLLTKNRLIKEDFLETSCKVFPSKLLPFPFCLLPLWDFTQLQKCCLEQKSPTATSCCHQRLIRSAMAFSSYVLKILKGGDSTTLELVVELVVN